MVLATLTSDSGPLTASTRSSCTNSSSSGKPREAHAAKNFVMFVFVNSRGSGRMMGRERSLLSSLIDDGNQ